MKKQQLKFFFKKMIKNFYLILFFNYNMYKIPKKKGYIIVLGTGFMNTLNNFLEKIKKSGLFIVLTIFSFYFTLNAIKGDRGIFKYMYLKNKVEIATKEKAKYQAIKRDLEYKVSMLSEDSLDLDYLEERARIVLNMVDGDEYIILDKDIDKR